MDNNKTSSIFDNTAYLSWIKTPTCSNCLMEFTAVPNPKSRERPRRPYLLPCSHTICEKCLLPNVNFVKCPECQSITKIDRKRPILTQFDINYFLYGVMLYLENNLPYELVNFYQSKTNSPNQSNAKNQQQNKPNYCCECSETQTNQFCTSCKGYYCQSCFTRVHSMAKSLKGHKLTMPHQQNNRLPAKVGFSVEQDNFVNYCQKHPNEQLNYYCISCRKQICEDCKMLHLACQLSRVLVDNRKALPQLRTTIERLKKGKLKLIQAQQEIQLTIDRLGTHGSNTALELAKNFIEIHADLQNIEKKMMMSLKNYGMQQAKYIFEQKDSLVQAEKSLDDQINLLSSYASNIPHNKYLLNVIEEANAVLTDADCSPMLNHCFTDNPFQYNLSKRAIYESLIVESDKRNSMYARSYSTANWKMTNQNRGSFEFHYDPSIGSMPNTNFNNSDRNRDQNDKMRSNRNQRLSLGSMSNSSTTTYVQQYFETEKIVVSHIKDPTHFYVNRGTFAAKREAIQKSCQEEACVAAKPIEIKLNRLYLVYSSQNIWQRARAIAKAKDGYRVYFIDYGNEETVTNNKFRDMSIPLRAKANGAVLCSLYNIEPKNGEWTNNTIQIMIEMMLKNQLTMIVVWEETKLFVDLITDTSEYKTSIRDILIFLDCATKIPSKTNVLGKRVRQIEEFKENMLNPKNRKSFEQYKFQEGEIFKIKIRNVVSPSEFYITKADMVLKHEEMSEELNHHYNVIESQSNILFLPKVGMLCVAHYEDAWHRGRIVHVLDRGMCDIWLVDLGILRKISWKLLRVLDDKFLTIKEAVVSCSLSDITPLPRDRGEWNPEAIKEFKLFSVQALTAIVGKYRDQQYQVLLYIPNKTSDIYINGGLVKMGLAKSTGSDSMNAEIPKESILDDIEEALINISLSQAQTASSNSLRVEVEILNVISPDEFYIRVAKHTPSIMRMHKEIQNEMKKKPQPDHVWNESDNCYAQTILPMHNSKWWYRAVIIAHCEDVFTVFLKDYGFTVDVSFDDLSIIDPIVADIGNGAIQCHLACVTPTGGSIAWTKTAVDEFSKATARFDGYGVSLQGANRGDSRSVILWGMINDDSDPLAPSFVDWTNINNFLFQRGFVHLDKRFEPIKQNDMMEQQIAPGLDDLNTWLQTKLDSIIGGVIERKSPEYQILKPKREVKHCGFEFSMDICVIEHWLPAKKFTKSIFIVVPTYVDNNAVIYFHEAEKEPLLTAMKTFINDTYIPNTPKSADTNFEEGDPCLVQFHLDGLFYRGLILAVNENEYKVQFIDYGNIETCSIDELRKDVILGHIPVQAQRAFLGNIKPKNETWTIAALDLLHRIVCDHICTIRTVDVEYEDDDIVAVTVKTNDNIDVHSELIQRGHAEFSKVHFLTTKDILMEFDESDTKSRISSFKPVSPPENDFSIFTRATEKQPNLRTFPKYSESPNDPLLTLEDYEEIFPKDQIKEFIKDVDEYLPENPIVDNDVMSAFGIEEDDESIRKSVVNQKMNNFTTWYEELEMCKKDDDEFSSVSHSWRELPPTESDRTATTLIASCPIESDKLKMLTIDKTIKGFLAKTSYLLDTVNLMIEPQLEMHQNQMKKMTKEIQEAARNQSNALVEITVGMICLAKYQTDGLFYRAIVREHDIAADHVRVIFVDYINIEVVKSKYIRRCPPKFLSIPLQNIQVKLSGIRCNPRLRESDVERKLGELLEDDIIYVKIIQNDKIPTVSLYDKDEQNLIYQDMITESYYVPVK